MTETIKRYWPAEVLTDRWEMGHMEQAEDGDYVLYEDYQELENKLKEKDKIIAEYRKVAIDAMSLRFD